jgi:hypothetical protein
LKKFCRALSLSLALVFVHLFLSICFWLGRNDCEHGREKPRMPKVLVQETLVSRKMTENSQGVNHPLNTKTYP